MAAASFVIDVGNTRIKWGRLDAWGSLVETFASEVDEPDSWTGAIDRLVSTVPVGGAVASVNPAAAERLEALMSDRGIGPIRWFRSANDVPVRHRLDAPDRTGADRALAVLAAVDRPHRVGPGIVVQCGTAITVERIGPDGTWHGGAIAIGPSLASRALRSGTAQLPEVPLPTSDEIPKAWGTSTDPALVAGIVWGAVGAVRELISRQSEGLDPTPWILWTGGDASTLSRLMGGLPARVVPDLVLIGLARAAFGPPRPD